LPPQHQCARLHGHNYVVEIELASEEVDWQTGFVLDYAYLDLVKQWLDGTLDHRHLNAVLGGSRETTAENLAKTIFEKAQDLLGSDCELVAAVRVSETPKVWAEYRER
jgi:6-pyruvoyltetrahydropterin/6-carboxytetrahydropterin synthase